MVRPRPLLFAFGAAVLVAGCFETARLIPEGSGGGGNAGPAAGGMAAGGDAVGGMATGGDATGGDATGAMGGGGGPTCVPASCPGTDNDCRARVCDPGCDYAFQNAGTLCDDDGGARCDGAGNCVECTDASHCGGNGMVCANNTCLPGNLADGAACADSAQCTSAICHATDGVCCDAACAGTCESCLGANTCGTDGTCAPVTAGTDPDAECGLNKCFAGACLNGTVAFVTSAAYNGNFGGVAGADALCMQHAAAACLPGTYVAWLSDATVSPSTRFTQQNLPYRTVTGGQIAVNYASLVDNNIDMAFDVDQHGNAGPASTSLCGRTTLAYSGTQADGTPADPTRRCSDWTSSSAEGSWGDRAEANNLWGYACEGTGGGTCSVSAPLYCFQQ